jgi:hypothetical protein
LGQSIIGWGTLGTADARMMTGITPANSGCLSAASGADAGGSSPYVADGLWHHGVVVEDNAAADAVKRKLYLDGRCVAGSTVLTSLTAVGANAFRVGANPQTGSAPFTGVIDGAFVIAAALTSEQVWNIYNIGSQGLPASPKSEGDHIETFEISRVLARFDSLEGTDFVDMAVLL